MKYIIGLVIGLIMAAFLAYGENLTYTIAQIQALLDAVNARVSTSAGVADAGKMIVLDASGVLDSTIAAGTTQEASEDYTGGMFSGNTETRVTVTYDDAGGKINVVVDDMNDDTPDDDSEVPNAITVTAQAGSTWSVADSIDVSSVYSGTTSLEESTAANDSGASLIGVFDEFSYSNSSNVQDVLDDLDASISAGSGTLTTIETGDVGVGDADIITMDFDATVFDVTEAPDTEINIDIANDGIDSQHYAAGSIDAEHLAADIIDGTKIGDDVIDSEHYVAGSVDAEHLAADIIDETKLADDSLDSEHYNDASIDRAHLSSDVIDSTRLEDEAVDSEHYVDASIDEEHLNIANAPTDEYVLSYESDTANFQWIAGGGDITNVGTCATGACTDDFIDGSDIGDDTIDSEHYAAGSIDAEHLVADVIDETKLADNSLDSEHYNDASIDPDHLNIENAEQDGYVLSYALGTTNFAWVAAGGDITNVGTCTTGSCEDDFIDGTDIGDDVIDSEHYAAASIDAEHLAADIVDETKIADNGIDSEHYNDASIDPDHLNIENAEQDGYVLSYALGTTNFEWIAAGGDITNVGTCATGACTDDFIDGTDIADDAIDSEHYAALSIDTGHIAADAVDGTKIANDAIDSEHYVALSIDAEHLVADIIDETKLADDSLDSEHYNDASIDLAHLSVDSVDGTKIADDAVDSEHYAAGSIDAEHLAADIIDETKIADNGVDSEHYNDASIDEEHLNIANAPTDEYILSYESDTTNFQWVALPGGGDITTVGTCTTGDCTDDFIDGTDVADDAMDSEHYTDGSIDPAHLNIANAEQDEYVLSYETDTSNFQWIALAGGGDITTVGTCTTGDCTDDFIDGTDIGDDVIDSAHYVAGSIDAEHLVADVIDETKLADDSIDSEHYNDGSIDSVHLAADVVDGTKVANDAIDSEHYAAASIDAEHLSADIIDETKLADNSLDSEHYNDASIDEPHLNVTNAPTDNYLLSYNLAGTNFTWVESPSGGDIETVGTCTTGECTDDFIDGTDIGDNVIDSEHYAAGSIDAEHLVADIIDETKLADDSIDSEHYNDASIDEPHLNVSNVPTDNYVLSYNLAGTNFTWVEQAAGSGDITTVGTCTTGDCTTDFIDGTDVGDDTIDSEHYVAGSIDLEHLAVDSVDGTKIADDAIDSEHYTNASIDAIHLNIANAEVDEYVLTYEADTSNFQWVQMTSGGTMTTVEDGGVQVGGSDITILGFDGTVFGVTEPVDTEILVDIADDGIDSQHYAAASIDAEHLAADIIDETKLADNSIDSEHYNDGSVDSIHLAADVVDETKLADDSLDSEHYNDASIDPAHLNIANAEVDEYVLTYEADTSNFQWVELSAGGDITTVGTCTTGDCLSDFIDGTDIVDDSINSEHYVAGSIDAEHLAADIIDETKLADNSIDSEHYNDASIDEPHLNATNAPTDNYLLSYNSGGTNFTWVAAGSGDVVGPGSSTDNSIARFSGTGGKTIQNTTGATIDDSGNLTALSLNTPEVAAPNLSLNPSGGGGDFDINVNGGVATFSMTATGTMLFDSPTVVTDGLGMDYLAYSTTPIDLTAVTSCSFTYMTSSAAAAHVELDLMADAMCNGVSTRGKRFRFIGKDETYTLYVDPNGTDYFFTTTACTAGGRLIIEPGEWADVMGITSNIWLVTASHSGVTCE